MCHSKLSDSDLLKILVGARTTARIYQGTLQPLFQCRDNPDRATRKIAAARELVTRWLEEAVRKQPALSSPGAVKDYLRLRLQPLPHEVFVALFLDSQNRVIEIEELFRGTLTQTSVYPREVVKRVLFHNAASVIFAHNHPSGNPEPSRADGELTQTLKRTLVLIDVQVLDHFIVGNASVVSFAERGLL